MRQEDTTDLERRVVAEMEQIIRSQPQSAALHLAPHDAFALIGLMQLACRHPGCTGYPRQVATNLVGQLAGMFDDDSAIAEAIRRGWEEH